MKMASCLGDLVVGYLVDIDEEQGMAKSVVGIARGFDADRAVEDAVELVGGIGSFVKPGDTVVVKPNAGHEYPPDTAVCTSPAVVAAVIKQIRKANPKEIIVAESAATGCDTLRCLEVSGIRAAAEAAGVERIIDIKRDRDLVTIPMPDARSDIKEVMLPRFLVNADVVVNVPIFKSHASMVFSCALKNIKGIVQDKVHYAMHQTDLAAAMVDVWSVLKNVKLTIADMIRPQEGYGPHTGVPVDFGCVVASGDPVALDATACRMVGLDVDRVDYFRAAIDRGVGNFDEGDIEIRGSSVSEVYKKIWLPFLEGFDAWPEYNIYEGGCSSCQSLLAITMAKLEALGEYEKNEGMSILLGRLRELPEGVKPGKDLVLFGRCTRPLKRKLDAAGDQCIFIDGCPPGESHPVRAFLQKIDTPDEQMLNWTDEERAVFRAWIEGKNHIFAAWAKRLAEQVRAKEPTGDSPR